MSVTDYNGLAGKRSRRERERGASDSCEGKNLVVQARDAPEYIHASLRQRECETKGCQQEHLTRSYYITDRYSSENIRVG